MLAVFLVTFEVLVLIDEVLAVMLEVFLVTFTVLVLTD